MTKDSAAIRDQLGSDPVVVPIITSRYDETDAIEEQSATATEQTLGHAWIVGTTTNAIVGVNTGTEDGQQQVVGGAGRISEVVRVVNPGNVFHEHFRDNDFQESSEPNTADWNTTLFRIAMNTLSDHATTYDTVTTFKSIFLNQETVEKAKITAAETKWNEQDTIRYLLSADGGSNWQEAQLNEEITFLNSGNDLKLMVVFHGNGAKDTYIEDLNVAYVVT